MGGSSENSRRQGKKGGRGSSGKEGTTPSWCLTYCYNWMSKAGNFEQAFPNTNIPESFKRTAIRFFCKEASESLCNANGTLPSNLTVTVDPTGNSTEPISCLSGDDCEMDECCVIGRSGMRCEKLSSLGDTCRNTEGNENPTDLYIFKCPCAEGLECQVDQSQNSMRGERRRKFEGQCVESNTTAPSSEMTTPDLIEVTPPIPTTCVEHMDCPLSQCCTISAEGDKSSGVCKSFSVEGATCSTPETFLEFSKVGACPCQAPNQCQTSTGFSSDPTVNGICKP
ncbi:hypothetical protein EB796_024069 [Bugula neritina]|uniref:Uncharacterized protein n=1 Tax=Bugula neritina TaxID=10212 RepID=A0A7J7IWH4_BUGNE|nr:hypothetical protein EB796_024069 [Bugula neritina]